MDNKMIKNILSPLLATLFLMLGNGFFLSFTSLRLNYLGYSSWDIGIVHSAYYLGLVVGALRAEKLINRVGHIRAFAGFAALATSSLMTQGLFSHPLIWTFARLVMGYSLAVFYIVVESWLLYHASAKTRGVILSLYMITLYSSQGISQYILEFVDLNGTEPFLIAGLLGAASAVPLTFTKSPSPELHEPSGHSLKTLFKKSHFGFSGCLISGILISSIYSFTPIFAQTNQLSVAQIMSACIFGGVFLQWPAGKLSDILDRRKVLFGVTVAAIIQSTLILLLEPGSPLIYPAIFILGGLIFTLYPLSITEVCDRLQAKDITKATGMLLLTYGIGSVMGPLLTPLCLNSFPQYGLFLFFLINGMILAAIGIRSFLFSKPVPEDLQTDFVALPRVTPVAYELDPRSKN